MKNEYYHNRETAEEYIRLAKDVSGKELIDRFSKYLSPESHILELGSGPGTDWKILSEQFHTTGSDLSEVFIEHLKSNYPEGQFLHLDAIGINTDLKFDGIYANKVLHHLTNEELVQSIRTQAEHLNGNGIVCHSYWKGDGDTMFNGMFVNYFQVHDLKTLYNEQFKIVEIEEYQEFESNDSILVIAQKEIDQIQVKQVAHDDRDFIELVNLLNQDLAQRDGEDSAFYSQHNNLEANAMAVVVYVNDKPVSCGAFKPIDPHTVEIKRMYTLPSYRRKGLASKVIIKLEDMARYMEYSTCRLETGKRQPEAIASYQKHGYKIIDNFPPYVGIDNSVCFEKKIG